MILKKVIIQDYRSCLNTSFDLHPNLSVLIGPNSSGKTNILNSILLLSKLTEEGPFARHSEKEPTGHSILKVWFELDGKQVILSVFINIFTDQNNSDIIISSRQKWDLRDFNIKTQDIEIPLQLALQLAQSPNDQQVRDYITYTMYRHGLTNKKTNTLSPESLKPLKQIAEYLSQMRYYSASQFTNPANCPVSFEIENDVKRGSRGVGLRGHSKFLYDIFEKSKSDKSNYIGFKEIIGPDGIGLIDDILFKEIPTSSIEYSVRSGGSVIQQKREKILVIPQFRIGNNNLSPNQLSEGTFKTITLLFYLITETSKLLLIEEPEVCVHHGLLSSIIELIKTYSLNKQIIVTTHSDFVLDEVEPENVYKVTNRPEEGTKIYHITQSMPRRDLAALKKYLQTEGNLGEYWRHGGLD